MWKKKKQAFTLMEMIIVLAITTVILGITTSMFITGNRVFSDSDVKSTLQMEGQTIHEQMSSICMQGSDIESVTLKDSSTPIQREQIKNIIALTDIKEIVVNLRNEDLTPKPYTFTLVGKELKMKYDINTKDNTYKIKLLSDKVKSFKFIPNGDSGGKFQVDLEYKKGISEMKESSLDIDFIFRNRNLLN